MQRIRKEGELEKEEEDAIYDDGAHSVHVVSHINRSTKEVLVLRKEKVGVAGVLPRHHPSGNSQLG
jgi:uncharacterized protein (DUF1786 family)